MPPQFLQLLLTFKRRDWFSEQSVWLRCSRGRTHLLYRSLGAVACKHMHSHAYSTHAQILPRPRGSFYVSVTKYYTEQRETHFVWIQGGGQEGRIEGTKGTTVARVVKHIVEVFRGVKCWTTYPISADSKSTWIPSGIRHIHTHRSDTCSMRTRPNLTQSDRLLVGPTDLARLRSQVWPWLLETKRGPWRPPNSTFQNWVTVWQS